MKLKVNDLYNLSLGLAELSVKELPIKLAFKIQRAQKIISEELIASDKLRKKLIDKHKEKDFDDGSVQIKKNDIKIFGEKMDELMQQEVEVNIEQIDMKELEKTNIKIKTETLMQLESILKA